MSLYKSYSGRDIEKIFDSQTYSKSARFEIVPQTMLKLEIPDEIPQRVRYPRLDLRFSHDQIQRIEAQAKAEGLNRSEWAKRKILLPATPPALLGELTAAQYHLNQLTDMEPEQQHQINAIKAKIAKAIEIITESRGDTES